MLCFWKSRERLLNILANAEIRSLGLTEFLCPHCVLCLVSHMYVLIFLVSAAYCAQSKTLDFSSELSPTDVRQESTPSGENDKRRSLKGVNPARNFDQQILVQNVTDDLLETTSVLANQSSGNDGMQQMSLNDYEYYAYHDDFNLSDVAPEVLVDLGPEEMILSLEDGSPQRHRKPVKDGFVRAQEMELLRLHNFYRGNVTPPAADMSFMEWNDDLAKVAQDWANRCEFRHGFPPNSYPGYMGQNLYIGYDPTGVRALLMWYEEHQYYNLKTAECVGEQCGHYTQMVWGESNLVGCGMKRCGYRQFLVVCHYSPPGNIGGSSPYKVGKPCSQCQSDNGGLCTKKLCVTEDQCDRNKEICDPECSLECHNCGTLNTTTCKCSCADGWDSLDCSRRCKNDHDGCGKRNGFPTVTYCSVHEHNVANVHCREMCGRCRYIEDVNSTSTCCNGVLCDDGYVIEQNENLCNCRLLCPGPECYEDLGSLGRNTSDQDRGSTYGSISNEDNVTLHKNISVEGNGSLYKNISDEDNGITHKNILLEDSGSEYPSKNIHTILLVMTIQMTFFS